MAYFLFVDESGQDRRKSPYEVLAGVVVEDRDLWNMVKTLQDAEERIFGRRYTEGERELKASKILKTKTFRLAEQMPPIPHDERRLLAKQCLDQGGTAGRQQLAALAQAKLAYVKDVLKTCALFRCHALASIVPQDAPRPEPVHLRKDYAYLLERFFYFLEDRQTFASGIVVFDEIEKSQSHILVSQMSKYFKSTSKGRLRAGLIIPEPFFVHSDLTTGVQVADMIAYIISWGVRFTGMQEPARPELDEYAKDVLQLRYRTTQEIDGNPDYKIWSFSLITDLRPKDGRES